MGNGMLAQGLRSPYFAFRRSKILAELYPRDAYFCIFISHLVLRKFFVGEIAEAEP